MNNSSNINKNNRIHIHKMKLTFESPLTQTCHKWNDRVMFQLPYWQHGLEHHQSQYMHANIDLVGVFVSPASMGCSYTTQHTTHKTQHRNKNEQLSINNNSFNHSTQIIRCNTYQYLIETQNKLVATSINYATNSSR